MSSYLYEGQLRHRRFTEPANDFNYSLFMLYIDLAELPRLFDNYYLWSARHFNLAWFRRADHLGNPALSLEDAVRDRIKTETGILPDGPIRLLTHLRYFGYGFNPVSFYYCFDKQDRHLEMIVAEVNNTPWGEQHCYVLDEELNKGIAGHKRYLFDKCFHVSPYMQLNIGYDWRFNTPGKRLVVHMENHKDNNKLFDATLTLTRSELNSSSLARVLVKYPVMTLKVIAMIYWQAFRLWRKRAPFHTHPEKAKQSEVKES